MSDGNDDILDEPGLTGDYVEIDWEPLQDAIDALADGGLDVDDDEVMRDHLAALLASLLRRMQAQGELDDEELAESAAEVAALAVQIALGDEEVPPFLPSEE
jgi:hypothetical protein